MGDGEAVSVRLLCPHLRLELEVQGGRQSGKLAPKAQGKIETMTVFASHLNDERILQMTKLFSTELNIHTGPRNQKS